MQVTSISARPNFISRRSQWRGLAIALALGAIAALAGEVVHAQNLDQGKSATRLFADNCASCHRNARGLAKGRFRVTLYLLLQNHYATNASSAWALASYLESVEGPQRPSGAAPRSRARASASRFSLRPPMPVPNR